MRTKICIIAILVFISLPIFCGDVELQIEQIKELIDNEQYDDAILIIEKAIQNFPGYEELYYLRGYYYIYSGDLKQAEQNFKIGIGINKEYANSYYGLGIVYMERGKYDLAETNFSEAVKYSNNDERKSQYYCGLARLYCEKEDYFSAIKYINTSIKLHEKGEYYLELGIYYRCINDDNKAIDTWITGLQKKFQQIQFKHYLYYMLAYAYYDNGKIQDAYENIIKSLELSPNNEEYIHLYKDILKELENLAI
jgi:tetratricopeptide (TPR) repeat protein